MDGQVVISVMSDNNLKGHMAPDEYWTEMWMKEKVTWQSRKKFQIKINNFAKEKEVTKLILQRKSNLTLREKHDVLIFLCKYN